MAACSLVAAVVMSNRAYADTITYEFSGSVIGIDLSPGNLSPSGAYSIGDTVSGSFTIDDGGSPDSDPTSDYGRYDGSTSATLSIGAGSWTGTGWSARVIDDRTPGSPVDGFSLFGSVTGTGHGSYVAAEAGIQDISTDLSIWSSDALSELFALEFSDWPSIGGGIRFDQGSVGSGVWEFVRIQLDTAQPVPEPASVALIGLGLLAVAGYRRSRRP